MVRKHPIKCQYCKKDTGYYHEDFMFMVITNDIKCPHCNKVFLPANNGMEFLQNSNLKIDDINFPTVYDKSTGIFIVDYPHKLK